MRILAAIDFGRIPVVQKWEFARSEDHDYLKVIDTEGNGSLMLRLERERVRPISNAEGAEKCYLGSLNITDVVFVSSRSTLGRPEPRT